MTSEDQDAALGRMVTRFSETKKRRAALIAEGQRLGELLDKAGSGLKNLNFVESFWDGKPDGYSRNRSDFHLNVDSYPDGFQVSKLLNDLREVAAEIRKLRVLLKDAGLSVE